MIAVIVAAAASSPLSCPLPHCGAQHAIGGELVTGSDKQERQLGCRCWDPTSQRCAVSVMTHFHFTLQFFFIFLYSESNWKATLLTTGDKANSISEFLQ